MAVDYEKRIKFLETRLQKIGKELDQVPAEYFKGAVFKQPKQYRSKDLGERHRAIDQKIGHVLDKIKAIRAELKEPQEVVEPLPNKPDNVC